MKEQVLTSGLIAGVIFITSGIAAWALNVLPYLFGVDVWDYDPEHPLTSVGPMVENFLWIMGLVMMGVGVLTIRRARASARAA